MKDVLVTVKTLQTDDAGETDSFELTSEGKFAEKNGAYLIKYSDAFLTEGAGNIITTIKVSGDNAVSVSRSGSYQSRFTIEQGKRCQSLYQTPYGTISMGFYGEKIENRLNPLGGEIKMIYTVDVNNSRLNRNEMTIKIKDI